MNLGISKHSEKPTRRVLMPVAVDNGLNSYKPNFVELSVQFPT